MTVRTPIEHRGSGARNDRSWRSVFLHSRSRTVQQVLVLLQCTVEYHKVPVLVELDRSNYTSIL